MTQGLFALLYLRLFIILVCPTIYQFTSILLFIRQTGISSREFIWENQDTGLMALGLAYWVCRRHRSCEAMEEKKRGKYRINGQ